MHTHNTGLSKSIKIVRQTDTGPFDLKDLLKRFGHLRKLASGERLLLDQRGENCLYYVVAGAIKSSLEFSDGEEIIIGLFLGSDIMIAQHFRDNDKKNVATALETTYVRTLPLEQIKELGWDQPQLQQHLLQLLSRRINDLQYRMQILRHSATERVAGFLIELTERNRVLSDGNIHLPLSRYDMGCYLGLTSETVCRVLCQLEQNGIIKKHKRTIMILNYDALIQNCGAYPLQPSLNRKIEEDIRH